METRLELVSLLLFVAGTGLQFMTRTTLSIPAVTLAVLAILLATASRLWSRRRRSVFDLAICSDQGDNGGRDAAENGYLDGAK
jgi:hypothetical protein